MSMARSNHTPGAERSLPGLLALSLVALAALLPAHARSDDRNKTIQLDADHTLLAQQGKTVVTGHVKITQGTLASTADKATFYRNDRGDISRVVLEGTPAHLQQQDDRGRMVRAHAETLDYKVLENSITLEGNAHLDKAGESSIDARRVVYNTVSSQMQAEGSEQQRVHMTLQPHAGGSDGGQGTH